MRSFLFILLASVLSAGQGVFVGSATTQGGYSMPISNPLVSMRLSPTTATLTQGSATSFTATGTNALGTDADYTSLVAWSSSNTSVVTMSGSTGTCVGVGVATVTGASGLIKGTATVNCQSPPASGADNVNCRPDGTWIGSGTDGPASLPIACYYTAISGTPSNGTVWPAVSTLAALQSTYASAHCGDVIQITAGSSITGPWTPAGKGCADSAYITVKSTGVSDPAFPPEGTRNFPCTSNVASIPNRPTYPCAAPAQLTAKLVAPSGGSAVVMNGTDHIRFIGIEFTRVSTPGVAIFNIVDLGSNYTGLPQTNHIIFDRIWGHGINADGQFPQLHSADTSTTRFLALAQSNHVAVIDSYMSDFYDNGGGDGGTHGSANGQSDSQCIGGGLGTLANSGWGVYKFVNNHCEGAAEGILLGGSVGPALTPNGCTIGVNCNLDVPTDIEVRRNYFFKSPGWNGNTTTPVSLGWPVEKNGFEMKIGARALFEGNLIENTWYQSQVGMCWSTAPKNQSDSSTGLNGTAPTALTNDFTYRYNYCYNTAYGIALYQSMDTGCTSCQAQGASRISIHDNLIGDDLNLGNLTGTSAGDETEFYAAKDTTGKGLNKINSVSLVHNTFTKGIRGLTIFGADSTGQMANWIIQNNIFHYANFGWGDIGNNGGCDTPFSFTNSAKAILDACVTTYTADHNAVFGWNGGTLGSKWPTDGNGLGNFFYTTTAGPGFTNYGTGDSQLNPGNYALTTSSPLHNAASDGKDVGADITTLVSKITNVRDVPSQQFTTGNLKIYPSSSTVELGTTVPFSCENNVNGTISNTCTWSIQSGVGTVTSNGIYTAPNASGSAVLQAINGSNLVTASINVTGTTPAATGDCATVPYAHSGAVENNCHMTHVETVGTITRNWEVVIPANYVSGQSGLIVTFGTSHGLHATNDDPCGPPTNEIAGWNPYLQTVPAPAPVLVCPEAVFDSTLANDKWNWLGDNQVTWTQSITPNDVDFIRQLILITVRDLNLNPKAVFVHSDFDAQGWEVGMAQYAAITNSDLIAGAALGNESSMNLLDSTFTVARSAAPHFGQTLPTPAVPVSVITETGVIVQQSSVYSYMCGLDPAVYPSSNGNYHPLTVDDTFRFWNQVDAATTTTLQPTGVGSSFCTGTYSGGNGNASTLEVRKDTGGHLNTAIYAYKLVGNLSKAVPWCSFDWNGGNTLGCNNPSTGSFVAMDFRNTTCSVSQPCNHFLDAGTGAASASGYDVLGIYWKFLKSHPRP